MLTTRLNSSIQPNQDIPRIKREYLGYPLLIPSPPLSILAQLHPTTPSKIVDNERDVLGSFGAVGAPVLFSVQKTPCVITMNVNLVNFIRTVVVDG